MQSETELDPIWVAEFRGFFCGEGYLGITSNGWNRRRTSKAYVPRAQITLRLDDLATLQDIQSKLGGSIHYERRGRVTKHDTGEYHSRAYAAWRVNTWPDVKRVCLLLKDGNLPFKKREIVSYMLEFLEIQMPKGKNQAEQARQASEQRENIQNKLAAWRLEAKAQAIPQSQTDQPAVGSQTRAPRSPHAHCPS